MPQQIWSFVVVAGFLCILKLIMIFVLQNSTPSMGVSRILVTLSQIDVSGPLVFLNFTCSKSICANSPLNYCRSRSRELRCLTLSSICDDSSTHSDTQAQSVTTVLQILAPRIGLWDSDASRFVITFLQILAFFLSLSMILPAITKLSLLLKAISAPALIA